MLSLAAVVVVVVVVVDQLQRAGCLESLDVAAAAAALACWGNFQALDDVKCTGDKFALFFMFARFARLSRKPLDMRHAIPTPPPTPPTSTYCYSYYTPP